MAAVVRSLAAQRDRDQRRNDDRLLAEAERIRDGLSNAGKQSNSKR